MALFAAAARVAPCRPPLPRASAVSSSGRGAPSRRHHRRGLVNGFGTVKVVVVAAGPGGSSGWSGDGTQPEYRAPFEVPKNVFQDGTFPPEKKAATSMKLLFTMVALRAGGDGRKGDGGVGAFAVYSPRLLAIDVG